MSRIIYSAILILLMLPFAVLAKEDTTFVQGKDYELLTQPQKASLSTDRNKVSVVEFFNYGCEACSHFEPILEKWLKGKPTYVSFQRIPVIFHSQWEIYAKTYYVVEALNVSDKLTPVLFNALHNPKELAKNNGLNTPAAMQTFFASHGVKQQDFESAFNSSPVIDAQMQKGANLSDAYQVYAIPTLVINGKYKTGLQYTNGDHGKVIKIVQYLVEKSRKVS